MKIKNLMLFCYDFPHKKTQDFIVRLLVEGYKINYVLAAPFQKLDIPESKIRTAPKNSGLIHPRLLCQTFNIPYLVLNHNSRQVADYLKNHPMDLYIIAGARILSENIIDATNRKVLNIHPGLLPEIRGLDTLLWSIYNNQPIGITAHFISSNIDSGLFIYKEKLKLYKDDTIIDVSLRLLEYQIEILIKSIKVLEEKELKDLKNLDDKKNPYYSKMPISFEKKTCQNFPKWLKMYL